MAPPAFSATTRAIDVDHRRTGRSAGSSGGSLVVKRVEVIVLAIAVLRRLPIEPRQGPGQNRQLLAGVVADYADLAPDHSACRIQRQFCGLNELEFRGVVMIDAKIMDRIAVTPDKAELPRDSGKMACAVTGPGVTTWRLVNMRPRFASMTKPVACPVVFHSVSKARVLSICIVTTPLAIRSRVCAQLAGEAGMPGATMGAAFAWAGAAKTG